MKKSFMFLSLLCFLIITTAVFAQTTVTVPEATGLPSYNAPEGGLLAEILKRGVIRNGVECQNPPGEFYDPKSKSCTGYSIELAQKFADYLGIKLEVIDTSWAGVIPSLYTGGFDMIWSSMTITEARKKAVNFSNPYGCDEVVWVVETGNKIGITSPADLNGKIVGTQLNSAAESQAVALQDEYSVKYKELKSFDHFDGAFLALSTGQADIATSTQWNNIPIFQNAPGKYEVAFSLPIYNFVGVATRMQNPDLTEKINEFMAMIEESGEMADLQNKYYGYTFECGEQGPNPPVGYEYKAPAK